MGQLLLPVTQHAGIGSVSLQAIEQRRGAALAHSFIQTLAERTEMAVLAITEGQHGILEVLQLQVCRAQAPRETRAVVRRLAFAIGADDEQDAPRWQPARLQRIQRQQLHVQASFAKLLSTAFGIEPGLPALAGIGHHKRRGRVGRCCFAG